MLSVDWSGSGLPRGAGARQRWVLRVMGKGFGAGREAESCPLRPVTPALQNVRGTRHVLGQAEKEKRGLFQQEGGSDRPWRRRGIKPSQRTDWKPLSRKWQTRASSLTGWPRRPGPAALAACSAFPGAAPRQRGAVRWPGPPCELPRPGRGQPPAPPSSPGHSASCSNSEK